MRKTIDLKFDYKLHVLAPDEGKTAWNGKPCWQVLIDGTPDEIMSSEGLWITRNASVSGLTSSVKRMLYNHVSSSVVDETWSRVEKELEAFYKEYGDSKT